MNVQECEGTEFLDGEESQVEADVRAMQQSPSKLLNGKT